MSAPENPCRAEWWDIDPVTGSESRPPESAPGVARVFGCCSEHGNYELPIGSIESGEVPRKCPACAPACEILANAAVAAVLVKNRGMTPEQAVAELSAPASQDAPTDIERLRDWALERMSAPRRCESCDITLRPGEKVVPAGGTGGFWCSDPKCPLPLDAPEADDD